MSLFDLGVEILSGLLGAAIFVIPAWRICTRVGFPPALALVMLIPGLGFLILLSMLGFVEWPRTRSEER